MAKRSRGVTRELVLKRWKEGRGQGEGDGYKPWLTIQDVPSQGQVNRVSGWKTGREHHLLSLNELRYFYLLEWSPIVTDIREQFPLWPPEETQDIARHLGHKYPMPPGGGVYVMTSDFRVTLEGGGDVIRTVKEGTELDEENTLVKLDIEREFWRRRGVDWGLIVAEDLPLPVVENIQWLHPHLTLHGSSLDPNDVPTITRYLTAEVRGSHEPLASIARRCDEDLDLLPGSCLALARHLLATRQWQVDMTTRINPARPISLGGTQEV